MPSAVFGKMNLKDQTDIVVLNAPTSFQPELAGLEGVRVRRTLTPDAAVSFALAFVTTDADVTALAPKLAKAATGDAMVWFAYPKATSKKYVSTISRDTGWTPLGRAGFEAVRMIAIDDDWTAVRFRRAEYIKTMTRSADYAMSKGGKAKAGKKGR
jgi:hypothetical protein